MSQAKKSLYDLYPRLIDKMVNEIRGFLPKHERKKNTQEVAQIVFEQMPYMTKSLDFMIMAEELFWQKQGANVIFPESEVVLDNFSRAKFSLETSEGFDLPYTSFMLALPNNYKFMGTMLPALMVSFYPYHDAGDLIIHPFHDWLKLRRPDEIMNEPDVEPGSRAIAISYRDPVSHNMGYARLLVSEHKIPALLKAENLETFAQIMGSYKKVLGVVDLNEEDLDIQFKAIKLVAALGVYHLATEGQRLKQGFPGQALPRMNHRNPDLNLRMNTLSSSIPTQLQKASPEAHYRTWHIRQLRDERFYKGEYEKAPKGSRFVFVSDAVVGSKITPSTQT
jgi:hypothetical protein